MQHSSRKSWHEVRCDCGKCAKNSLLFKHRRSPFHPFHCSGCNLLGRDSHLLVEILWRNVCPVRPYERSDLGMDLEAPEVLNISRNGSKTGPRSTDVRSTSPTVPSRNRSQTVWSRTSRASSVVVHASTREGRCHAAADLRGLAPSRPVILAGPGGFIEVADRGRELEPAFVYADAAGVNDQNSPETISISSTSSPLGPRKNMFFATVPLDVLTVWMGEGACPPAFRTRSAAAAMSRTSTPRC